MHFVAETAKPDDEKTKGVVISNNVSGKSQEEILGIGKFADTKRSIGLRLGILARTLRQMFDRRVANLGVTRSQWSMIVTVARHPGTTQRVIAEALEMSEASAGRLVDRLCVEGLLRRQERDDDRRARAVFLTDKATPLLEKLSDLAKESEEMIFRGFSSEELEQLQGYLDRINHNITTDGR